MAEQKKAKRTTALARTERVLGDPNSPLVSNDNARTPSPVRTLLTSVVVAVAVLAPVAYFVLRGSPVGVGTTQELPATSASREPRRQPVQSPSPLLEVVIDDEVETKVPASASRAAPELGSPCRVVDTPRRLTRWVNADYPVEVAVHEDRYYVGFVGEHSATGIVWSPRWRSVSAVERQPKSGIAAFVPTPKAAAEGFVVDFTGEPTAQASEGRALGPTTSLNHDKPLRLWTTQQALQIHYAGQTATLWTLPESSDGQRPKVTQLEPLTWGAATLTADQHAVRVGAFRLERSLAEQPTGGGEVHAPHGPRIVTSRLREVSVGTSTVRAIALAGVNDRVVLAAVLEKSAAQRTGSLLLALMFDPSHVPGKRPDWPASIEGVKADASVQIRPLAGRRWLLQWSSVVDGHSAVSLLTLNWDLEPLGPAIDVSPRGAPAIAAALHGDRHPASFYMVDVNGEQELWVQALHCR